MKLLEIKIKDFKNIRNIHMKPSANINLLEGDNYNGKTSLGTAIVFGLIGKTILDKELKTEDLINWFSEDETFNIYQKFEHLGIIYEQTLELKKGRSLKRELKIEGDVDVYLNSDATNKLAEVFPPQLTKYSSIAKQKEGTAILFGTGVERLDRMKEIFGVDKLKDIVEELSLDIKDAKEKSQKSLEEKNILESKEFSILEVPEVESIVETQTKYDSLCKDKEVYDLKYKEYTKYKESLEKYQEDIKEHDRLNKEGFNLLSEGESLSHDIIHISEDIEKQLEETKKKLSSIDLKKTKNENAVKEYTSYLNQKEVLDNKKDKIEKELSEIKVVRLPKCKYSQEDIDLKQKEATDIVYEFTKIEEMLDKVEEGNCPTCGKPYEYDKKELENKFLDITELSTKVVQELKDMKEEVTNCDLKKQENDTNRKLKEEKQKQLDEVNIEIENFKNVEKVELIDFESEYSDLTEILREQEKLVKDRREVKEKIQEVDNRLKVVQGLFKQYENLTEPIIVEKPNDFDYDILEECKKQINVHEQKVLEKDRIEKHNEEQEAKQEENKKLVKEKKKEYDKIQKEISIWQESKRVLDKDFPAWLIQRGAEFIKESMNIFFQKICSDFEISLVMEKSSVNFLYSKGGGKPSHCKLASGFEQDFLSISVMASLGELQNFKFLFLDETDASSSSENSLKLYQTLINTLPDYQIFPITHHEETKEYLRNIQGTKTFNLENGRVV